MKYAPYSFSKIQTFFECQKKFEYTYVNKIPIDYDYVDPIYFKRGRFLHAYIADRLNGGDGLTISRHNIDIGEKLKLVEFADVTLNNEYISLTYDFNTNKVESFVALDHELKPSNKKNKSALSGYIDYYAVHDDYGMIVDWKSGKYHSTPHYFQLELYAIWIFQKYPEVTELDLVFYYVEHNKFQVKTINPNDVFELKTTLSAKITIIENTNTFEVNKSKKCTSCQFFNVCNSEFGVVGDI
jgi:CRISPR/Cas system-associated exonuclease Cas4 (RecB family)